MAPISSGSAPGAWGSDADGMMACDTVTQLTFWQPSWFGLEITETLCTQVVLPVLPVQLQTKSSKLPESLYHWSQSVSQSVSQSASSVRLFG